MPKLADGSPAKLGRRDDLVRLDEPHARHSVAIDKEPQKRLAVAVDAADDLLLPHLPAILVHETRRAPSAPASRRRLGASMPLQIVGR